MLRETKLFFENVCREDADLDEVDLENLLKDCDVPRLTEIESQNLEGLITPKEALESLKKMKNDKSPGSDGFTAEFF